MNFKNMLETLSHLSDKSAKSEFLSESKNLNEDAGHSVLDIISKAQLDKLCKMHNDGKDFTDDKALCDKFCEYYDLEKEDKAKVKSKVMKDYGAEIKARCEELSSENINESEELFDLDGWIDELVMELEDNRYAYDGDLGYQIDSEGLAKFLRNNENEYISQYYKTFKTLSPEQQRHVEQEVTDRLEDEGIFLEDKNKERPYVCLHIKKGKYECKATSSYGAAKKAADHWGLKSTSGINTYLADVEHTAVNESATLSQAKKKIEKLKSSLMSKKGSYENFGEKEVNTLKDTLGFNPHGSPEERQIAKMIQDFDDWAMSYDGPVNESLKDVFNRLSSELLKENQITMAPAPQNTQVIKKDDKVVGTVSNPNLANQLKRGIESGEVSLDQDMNEESDDKPAKSMHELSDEEFIAMLKGELNKDKSNPVSKMSDEKSHKNLKEGMSQRLKAARFEGQAHGLKGHSYHGKSYEDIEEAKAYHEGYKEGLDECYGMKKESYHVSSSGQVNEGTGRDIAMELEELAEQIEDLTNHALSILPNGSIIKERARMYWYGHIMQALGSDSYGRSFSTSLRDTIEEVQDPEEYDGEEDFLESESALEGNAFTAALANTEKGEEFEVGGKTFTNRTEVGEDFAFEAWDRELNDLLNEGLSVSISKGQQHTPDQVTVTASDNDADELLSLIKGLGGDLLGGNDQDTVDQAEVPHTVDMPQPENIEVVDDHDDMLSLMKKMAGEENSGSCSVCEDESEEQMEFQVDEASPLAEKDRTTLVQAAEEFVQKFEHLLDDSEKYEIHANRVVADILGHSDYSTESFIDARSDFDYYVEQMSRDNQEVDETSMASMPNHDSDFGANLGAGRSSATLEGIAEGEYYVDHDKDSGYHCIFHTDKGDGRAYASYASKEEAEAACDKMNQSVKENTDLNEWANDVGKKGTDEAFEQDIDFMTKVISGGLNKQKQDQTTLPHTKVKVEEGESPDDWKKLAGIK